MNAILKMTLNDEKRELYPGFKKKEDIFEYFEGLKISGRKYHNTTALHQIEKGDTIYFVLDMYILAKAIYLEQKYDPKHDKKFSYALKLSDIEIFYDTPEELKKIKGRSPIYVKDEETQEKINRALNLKTFISDITYETTIEGAKKKIYVNSYERSLEARKECIKKYGYECQICRFNFENTYGELGKEFIHVHHIVSLSKINKKYKVNGKKDLIPVCPNCHAMLHRKRKNPISIEELKKLIK